MKQPKPTKPYLKDLPGNTQYQFYILNKYTKVSYTYLKSVLITYGPITDSRMAAFIDSEFVDLLMKNEDAVKEVRSVRDYLNSISGDKKDGE